jgi:hypothetical protein
MLAFATFFPCLLFSVLFLVFLVAPREDWLQEGQGARKEKGRKRGSGTGRGRSSGGGRQRRHSISNIMIIKLGPTIAAYEACITLFLICLLSGVGGVSRRQAGMNLDWASLHFFDLVSIGLLLRELDLRFLPEK